MGQYEDTLMVLGELTVEKRILENDKLTLATALSDAKVEIANLKDEFCPDRLGDDERAFLEAQAEVDAGEPKSDSAESGTEEEGEKKKGAEE